MCGADILGCFFRESVACGVADDDIGIMRAFGDAFSEVAEFKRDIGIGGESGAIVFKAALERLAAAKEFAREDVRHIECGAEREIARARIEVGNGLRLGFVQKIVHERMDMGVGLCSGLTEIADAPPGGDRRQTCGLYDVANHGFAIVAVFEAYAGKDVFAESLLNDRRKARKRSILRRLRLGFGTVLMPPGRAVFDGFEVREAAIIGIEIELYIGAQIFGKSCVVRQPSDRLPERFGEYGTLGGAENRVRSAREEPHLAACDMQARAAARAVVL